MVLTLFLTFAKIGLFTFGGGTCCHFLRFTGIPEKENVANRPDRDIGRNGNTCIREVTHE